MKKPQYFYKFVSFARKDVLENGFIRFAPMGEFNDPFELEPSIEPYAREFIEYVDAHTNEHIKSIEITDEMIQFSIDRAQQVKTYSTKYREEIAKYGVLSLTANFKRNHILGFSMPESDDPRTNLLLWAHYADSHKGFIIEFKADFIENINLEAVSYTNERDYLTFEDIDENKFDHIFYKKSPEWAYEQEYRAVLPLEKAKDGQTSNLHLFEFNKAKVRSITFGCAMAEENKEIIKAIIKNDPMYSKVTYLHANRNDEKYMLDFYFDNGHVSNRRTEFSMTSSPYQFLKKHLPTDKGN